ncbi:hypothetical protein BC828DRAFT_384117, partial [Blastocladiella britannica]
MASKAINTNELSANIGPWHEPPRPGAGLAVMQAVLTNIFGGALLLQWAWALCLNPRPRTIFEWAMHAAAFSQLVVIALADVLTAQPKSYPWPPPPNADPKTIFNGFEAYPLAATVASVLQFVTLLLIVGISYRRARAIELVSPRAARYVAPALSVALILFTFLSRIANRVVSSHIVQDGRLPTRALTFLLLAQALFRTLSYQLAAFFALFSEGYVTNVIAQCRKSSAGLRRRHSTQDGSRSWFVRVCGRWRGPRSTAGRLRFFFSALICAMFFSNGVLTMLHSLGVIDFMPFFIPG